MVKSLYISKLYDANKKVVVCLFLFECVMTMLFGSIKPIPTSVCNLSTKEHKSKSAAITQTGNRVQNLAGVRNETKSSESKFGKAQVSIC